MALFSLMKILLVGATGTLGRQIAKCALDEGYDVRCLVRSKRKASFLKEWGAELAGGDLTQPETITAALDGVEAVIDAATTRATDSERMQTIDWDGKVALIKACKEANVNRFIFFSILDSEKYPNVPLMDIKHCTELYLAESGLDYTILRPCGFMQGLIGQYAIPILENQAIWVMGNTSPIAYMDTQDIAKFAVKSLEKPNTIGGSFPVVGNRAWGAYEIIRLCERLSGKESKVSRMPLGLLRAIRKVVKFFQWGWNVADRLTFTEVIAAGQPLEADMSKTYEAFGIEQKDITTLEGYLKEYFERIMKKLREIDYEKQKQKERQRRKRSPFKSSTRQR